MREPVVDCAPLESDDRADVCVVGAGLAGLSCAYRLAKEGRSVLVLDERGVGSGETGRTTAHLSNALDDRFQVLERVFGLEGARLAAESHTAAIDRIESIVRAESIECDFTRLDGYLLCGRHERSREILVRELEAAHRAGLIDAELQEKSPLLNLFTGPILRFPRQAQFHPLKYLDGLARAAIAAGARIRTYTRVRATEDGTPCRAVTTRGHTVMSDDLIVATNSPISDRLAIHTKQAAYRTYAMAFAVPANAVPLGLYWDTEDRYHYVRLQLESGGQGELLIVGGEDHKTGQADDAELRFARLEAWTREHFPACESIRHAWSGQVLEPVDHLAFIGRDPGASHTYIVTGDSGHGMTHATIGGMLIPDLILRRDNPWTQLYAPNRKSARTAGTYLRENLDVARHLAHHLMPAEVSDVRNIPSGTGRVLRVGTRRLAVYRDEQGAVVAHSAVCTHVGCIVKWNGLEKTWDCPCHGSRFDVTGEPVSGPARSPLAAVELHWPSEKLPPGETGATPRGGLHP